MSKEVEEVASELETWIEETKELLGKLYRFHRLKSNSDPKEEMHDYFARECFHYGNGKTSKDPKD